jgi:hypothetical protein
MCTIISLQLKAYVQRQSIFPLVDNTYSAKAVNNATFKNLLQKNGHQITEIVISLQCILIVLILVAVVTVVAVYGCSHKWCKRLQKIPIVNVYFRKKQASILAVTIVSNVIISYIIALDIAALARRKHPFNTHVLDIYNTDQPELDDPFRLLYEIPGIVIAFDALGAFFSIVMTIAVSIIFHVCPECLILLISRNSFFVLCLSTLGFISCIVTHIPFVAIAYLNDAYHAGSIFVYYTITVLVLFAVVEQLIASRQNKISFDHDAISLEDTKWFLRKGFLHFVSEPDNTSQLELHGEEEFNFLRVRSGQIKFDFKKVDTKIILDIEDGELNIEHSNTASEFLRKVNEQESKIITLDAKNILPTACMKSFTFSYLKPIQGQKLTVHKVTIPTDINEPIKVELGRTNLTLKRANQVRDRCLGCSCGWYTTLLVAIALASLLAIVAILTSYFIIIPINRSISDAPNRLVGIYESAIVLVGAYIAYKAFFKAKKYLESSVVNRNNPINPNSKDSTERWKEMSEEEKVAQFYDVIVDIIVDKNNQCRQQDTLQPNGQPQGTQPRDVHIGNRSNTWPAAGTAPGGQPETGSTTSTTADGKPTDSGYTQPATATCEKAPGIPPANVTGEAAHQGEGQLGTGLTTSTAAGALDKHTEYSQPATAILGEAGKGQSAAATEGGQHDITQPGTTEQDENREVNATQESREDTPPLSSNSVAERTPLLNT